MIRLLTAALLLSGCAAPLPGAPSRAGALGARAAGARPTFEAAFQAASRAAEAAAGGPVALVLGSGASLGPDGRPATAAGGFHFLFAGAGAAAGRGFDVRVGADGAVQGVDPQARTAAGTAYAPGAVTLAAVLPRLAATGFAPRRFDVSLQAASETFWGAGPDADPVGPPMFLVRGAGAGVLPFRLVSARTGAVQRAATDAELRAVAESVSKLLDRWRLAMTGGADRPLAPADLARGGDRPAAAVSAWIGAYDADHDGAVSRAELVAGFTTPEMLHAWREGLIKRQFWAADADGDERLTPAEAAGLRLAVPGGALPAPVPLGVTAADLAAADADGDGRLDADEYVPLGLAKTRDALSRDAALIGRLVFPEAKPWSH